MEPTVSVIIPVYNVRLFLREALDSVINQTYRNLDIIIVDDGSTDGSGEICDEYTKDARVRVIHQGNKGISGARNTGLELMKGDYVVFLDSDDAYRPNAIECMIDCITKHDADIMGCGSCTVSEQENTAQMKWKDGPDSSEEEILTGQEAMEAFLNAAFSVTVWNKIYSRKIWSRIRFPEGYTSEDNYVIPRLLTQCRRVVMTPRKLIAYRSRAGSISRLCTSVHMRDYMYIISSNIKFLEELYSSLPDTSMQSYRESYLRGAIARWAELRLQNISKEETAPIESEIQKLAKGIQPLVNRKTKIAWRMYRYCPDMIFLLRKYYLKLKRLRGWNR